MEARLFTIHRKGETGLEVIGDRFDLLGLVVPVFWFLWHRVWLGLVAFVVLTGAAAQLGSAAAGAVGIGVGLILAFDGAEVRRTDLRLRGWREAATLEARSAAGAEELYLGGRTA